MANRDGYISLTNKNTQYIPWMDKKDKEKTLKELEEKPKSKKNKSIPFDKVPLGDIIFEQ